MGVLFHIRVHEIADFSKAVYAVLEFRYAEGKVVRHGRIDRESDFDAGSGGFLGQFYSLIEKQFVASGLDEHRRQACEVAVEWRDTGITELHAFGNKGGRIDFPEHSLVDLAQDHVLIGMILT